MINKLHTKILLNKTPFGYAAVTALVIGVGDLVATGTDIIWLLGDMAVQTHSHHYPVLFGLTLAELIMAISFIWLYRSINAYLIKCEHKRIEARARAETKRAAKRRSKHGRNSHRSLSTTAR